VTKPAETPKVNASETTEQPKVNIQTKKDTEKPVIKNIVISPKGDTTNPVTVTVTATDNVGVTGYSFDGGMTWQKSNNKTYKQNEKLIIVAMDKAGNYSDLKIYNIRNIKNYNASEQANMTAEEKEFIESARLFIRAIEDSYVLHNLQVDGGIDVTIDLPQGRKRWDDKTTVLKIEGSPKTTTKTNELRDDFIATFDKDNKIQSINVFIESGKVTNGNIKFNNKTAYVKNGNVSLKP
jgi:hypothetical protein